MPRSVAELLGRRFEELELNDLRTIVHDARGEGESLWLEWKEQITTSSLAKACSAFANTFGGLLIVGVTNDGQTFSGIDPLAAEAQLWVKDTLRAHVLPMPPFRARWVDVDNGRGLLLVLVEASSTTPHLLTRSGAIYVRNPGSSDPVPLGDQRRLLDLTTRGQQATHAAEALATKMLTTFIDFARGPIRVTESLAIAATGATARFVDRLFSAVDTPTRMAEEVWGPSTGQQREGRFPRWMQHTVGVERFKVRDFGTTQGHILGAAIVSRDGGFVVHQGHTLPEEEGRGYDGFTESELRNRFTSGLEAGRRTLLDLGAHGDARIAYRLTPAGRSVHFDVRPGNDVVQDVRGPIDVALWTDFSEDITDRVFDEIARAARIGPRDVSNGH